MEENKKFYSQRAISISTYFGGSLSAGILIRENYRSLGKDKKGIYALIIGIITTTSIREVEKSIVLWKKNKKTCTINESLIDENNKDQKP